MNIDPKNEAAIISWIEAANPPDFSVAPRYWECDVCKHALQRGTFHVCTICYGVSFCPKCYSNYIEGGGVPKSAPKSLQVIEKLENELKNIRVVTKLAADVRRMFYYSGGNYLGLGLTSGLMRGSKSMKIGG
jgi:hypothetical protein